MPTGLPPGTYKVEGTIVVSEPSAGKITESFKGRVAKGNYKGHRLEWTKITKVKINGS